MIRKGLFFVVFSLFVLGCDDKGVETGQNQNADTSQTIVNCQLTFSCAREEPTDTTTSNPVVETSTSVETPAPKDPPTEEPAAKKEEPKTEDDLEETADDTTKDEPPPPPPPPPGPSEELPPAAPKQPTLATEFASNDLGWILQIRDQDKKVPLTPDGSITFGVLNEKSADNSVVEILLPGFPELEPLNASSPAYANQISTKELLSFGSYRVRAKGASCQPGEEVVTGIFTYSYGADVNGDGTIDETEETADTNQNGINDNNEIDIEILCGTPSYLWMTIWTDYTDDAHMQKVTRRVDLATGKIKQTSPGEEGKYGTNMVINETIGGLPVADFDATADFYEMGFDWQPDHVRYFIVIKGQEITLWNFKSTDQDPTGAKNFIPQNSAHFMLNVWHDEEHWAVSEDPADYPNQDVLLEVDWFKYWKE